MRTEGVAFLIIYCDVMPRGRNPVPLLPDLLRVGLTVAFFVYTIAGLPSVRKEREYLPSKGRKLKGASH